MSSTPPQYTLLPASPSIADEKEQQPAQLERAPSSSPSPNSPQARFRRAIFLCTGVLATTVLVGGLYGANVAMGGSCRWRKGGSSDAVTMQRPQLLKRAASSPTYSTSTYSDGETSTFVYTTRPIVNPGGYTIGTMTGYVAEQPTATATSLVAPSSSSSPTPSELEASSSAPSASPTYSTSTYGNGTATSTFVYTTRPIVNPRGYTIGTLTGYVPITSSTTSLAASSFFPAAPSPTAAPLAERDFAEVDMHLMHRRGVDFEQEAEDEVKTSGDDSAEYSFSTRKDGETVTYVKTTRPIINPGGYTIGTLDGAYVKAPKSTTAPRDELKRRMVELEA